MNILNSINSFHTDTAAFAYRTLANSALVLSIYSALDHCQQQERNQRKQSDIIPSLDERNAHDEEVRTLTSMQELAGLPREHDPLSTTRDALHVFREAFNNLEQLKVNMTTREREYFNIMTPEELVEFFCKTQGVAPLDEYKRREALLGADMLDEADEFEKMFAPKVENIRRIHQMESERRAQTYIDYKDDILSTIKVEFKAKVNGCMKPQEMAGLYNKLGKKLYGRIEGIAATLFKPTISQSFATELGIQRRVMMGDFKALRADYNEHRKALKAAGVEIPSFFI